MRKIWKEIQYYPLYEVSNFGEVRSWVHTGGAGEKRKEPRVLKGGLSSHGYMTVVLHDKKKAKTSTVHKLVLDAFIGKKPEGTECSHIDGVKTNNKLDNLRWDTHKNNILEKNTHGTMPKGDNHFWSKLKEKDIPLIRKDLKKGISARQIGFKYGVIGATILAIKKGKTWKHVKTN